MTKDTITFEIRVAVVGYVSVGKSTVLNALLGDKFTEISLRRTTAAVNHFRIIPSNNLKERSVEPEQKKRRKDDVENVKSWSAEATHAVIAKDNKILRSIDDDTVVEKTFDIHVEDMICEMRNDTQLVLVDIPGINEADSSKKYKDYVQDKWNTFDCVVVVMDAVQGVNTMEQVELLKFVASNNEHQKHVPTIILGNKADDPEDSEKMELVKETRTKCEEIFGQTCSESALLELTDVAKKCEYVKKNTDGAVFIPISAMNAFIYRRAVHLTPETFRQFDKDVMDKIGRDEVGRQWKSFSLEQKVKTIHNAISDSKAYEERLADTNFDKFLKILCYFIGGEEAQTELIKSQNETLLKLISTDATLSIGPTVRHIFHTSKALGQPTDELKKHFWDVYEKREKEAVREVESTVDPSFFQSVFFDLESYFELAESVDWKDEVSVVVERMKNLVRQQLFIVISNEAAWSLPRYDSTLPTTGRSVGWTKPKLSWNNLSPHDWGTILFSILLPSSELEFNLAFGSLRRILEERLLFYRIRYNPSLIHQYDNCYTNHTYNNSLYYGNERTYVQACRKMDAIPSIKEVIVSVEMPAELSDPSHWGYLGYKYISFCRSHK